MSQGIEKIIDGNVREYWVVFTQGTDLLSKFLKKDFSHIYIITRDKYNWMVINPLRLYLDIIIAPYPINYDLPRLNTGKNSRVVKVTMYTRASVKQFARFGLLNCVTFARYTLGLRMAVLTPFSFYKRLLHLKPSQMSRHGIQSVTLIA